MSETWDFTPTTAARPPKQGPTVGSHRTHGQGRDVTGRRTPAEQPAGTRRFRWGVSHWSEACPTQPLCQGHLVTAPSAACRKTAASGQGESRPSGGWRCGVGASLPHTRLCPWKGSSTVGEDTCPTRRRRTALCCAQGAEARPATSTVSHQASPSEQAGTLRSGRMRGWAPRQGGATGRE